MGLKVDPGDIVMPKEHEFDVMENETFNGLAGSMGFVGIMSIIFGVLQMLVGLLAGLPQGLLTMGQGAVLLVMGGWLWNASRSFRDIVRTEGNDVTHLMSAMRKLRSVYFLQAILIVIACVLVFAVIVLAMMAKTKAGN